MTHFIAVPDIQPHEDRTRYRVYRLKRSVPIELGYTDYIQHHALTEFDRNQLLRETIYNLIIATDSDYTTRDLAEMEELSNDKLLGIHILS